MCVYKQFCCYYATINATQGVTGYEGAFRKSCEAAMKVLRQDSDALIWYSLASSHSSCIDLCLLVFH